MPKEETFPMLLKYIDVTRTTNTSMDVMIEKHIGDYCSVDGEKELSDAWTVHMVREETYKKTRYFSS